MREKEGETPGTDTEAAGMMEIQNERKGKSLEAKSGRRETG